MAITVKAPTYGAPKVDTAPIRGGDRTATPTADSAGVNVAWATADLGAAIFKNEALKQDQVAVLEADRQMSDWENRALYDPQKGALSRRGKDAFSLPDEIGQQFSDQAANVRKALSNDRQRLAFDRATENRRRNVNTTLSRHVFSESEKLDDLETEASVKNAQSAAIANYTDNQRVSEEISRQVATITLNAKRKGIPLDSDVYKNRVSEAISATHAGVINRYLSSGQDRAARVYFEGSGDAGEGMLKQAPGMIEVGNINLKKRDIARNENGTISTVRSLSFNDNGVEVVIPTVVGGKVVSDDEAVAHYRKTGQFLGKFDTAENADKFAAGLSAAQAKFYGGAKNFMTKSALAEAEAKIQVASTLGEGQRGSNDIWSALGPKGDRDAIQLDKMMDEARKRYADDPKVLHAVEQGLREKTSTFNAAARERTEAAGSVVWSRIEKGARLEDIRRSPEFLSLPGREQTTIRDYLTDREHTLGNRGPATDWNVYYNLSQMASSQTTRGEFMRLNLNSAEYRSRLSNEDFKHFAAQQAALRSGNEKEAERLSASERVQGQIVDQALLSMGLDPTPNEKTSESKRSQIIQFRRTIREQVRSLEQRTGKNATDADVQSIVDNMIVKGINPSSGVLGLPIFRDERRVYELKPGENIVVDVKDIPRDERAKIEDALRRNGMPINDQAVKNLYSAKLLKMRGEPAAPAPQQKKPEPKKDPARRGGSGGSY